MRARRCSEPASAQQATGNAGPAAPVGQPVGDGPLQPGAPRQRGRVHGRVEAGEQAPRLSQLRLLVVDDVADSGRTLALVLDLMREMGADARSAVIYGKPRSVIRPDYLWKATDDWIVFPWSAAPPVTAGA